MAGNITYHYPNKLYFGGNALEFLNDGLPRCGKTVKLIYGGTCKVLSRDGIVEISGRGL